MRLTLDDIRYLKDNGFDGSYLDVEYELRDNLPEGDEELSFAPPAEPSPKPSLHVLAEYDESLDYNRLHEDAIDIMRSRYGSDVFNNDRVEQERISILNRLNASDSLYDEAVFYDASRHDYPDTIALQATYELSRSEAWRERSRRDYELVNIKDSLRGLDNYWRPIFYDDADEMFNAKSTSGYGNVNITKMTADSRRNKELLDSIGPTINPGDDIAILGHSSTKTYFGQPFSSLAESLGDDYSKCYLGTCYGKDVAPSVAQGLGKEVVSNVKGFWPGFNPYKNDFMDAMFSDEKFGFAPVQKGREYDIYYPVKLNTNK